MRTCRSCRYTLTAHALGCLKYADFGRPYEVIMIKHALETHDCEEYKENKNYADRH